MSAEAQTEFYMWHEDLLYVQRKLKISTTVTVD